MMKRIALLAAICLWGAPAFAASMLAPSQYDPGLLLPPPPPVDTPRARAEITELERLQAEATPAQREQARYDHFHQDGMIFAPVLGPAYDLSKLPATKRMIRDVLDAANDASGAAKDFFHRDRPWIVDAEIDTCAPHLPGPATNSYPSGHTLVGYSIGVVLASLMPARAQDILARARDYGENRMICGYHFRSDVMAGEEYGGVIATQLLVTPAFRPDYEAARAELHGAGLIP